MYFGIPKSIILDRDIRFLSAFWTALWEKMNPRLKRSTTFHPQTDGQIEVVNRALVHLLRGYNQKHPRTWDENFIYAQHPFNREVHTSTSKSPFGTGFGYLPLSPLDVVYGQREGAGEDTIGEALIAERFIDKIRQIHLQIQETLQKSQEKYNT